MGRGAKSAQAQFALDAQFKARGRRWSVSPWRRCAKRSTAAIAAAIRSCLGSRKQPGTASRAGGRPARVDKASEMAGCEGCWFELLSSERRSRASLREDWPNSISRTSEADVCCSVAGGSEVHVARSTLCGPAEAITIGCVNYAIVVIASILRLSIESSKMNPRFTRNLLVGAASVACAGYAAASAGIGASDAPWWGLAAGLTVLGDTASVSAYVLVSLCGLLIDGVTEGTASAALAMGAAVVVATACAWSYRRRFAQVVAEVDGELDERAPGGVIASASAAARAPELG